MRDHAKVSPTFWTGTTGKALRLSGTDAVMVALYLMTAPGSNMLGLYYLPLLYIAHETPLGFEGASKGLQACIDAGYCRYDAATETVWVIEMAAWQMGEELKASDKRCLGIQKFYESLPENPFLGEFFDRYQSCFHLSGRRASEGASKPLRSKETETETEKEVVVGELTLSSSSSAPQPTPPICLTTTKAERLAAVTTDAIVAFNSILSVKAKPEHGLLPSVHATVGHENRRKQVGRCLKVARDICQALYGNTVITPEFWREYFGQCAQDPFKSGRQAPGKGHENWTPSFEYLTRPAVMLEVFDKSGAGDDGEERAA